MRFNFPKPPSPRIYLTKRRVLPKYRKRSGHQCWRRAAEKIQSNEAVEADPTEENFWGGSGSGLLWCALENLFWLAIYLWNTKGRNGQYTKELWIDRRGKSKSLAWSSVLLALGKIKKVGEVVERPKALGDIRGLLTSTECSIASEWSMCWTR